MSARRRWCSAGWSDWQGTFIETLQAVMGWYFI
jgi:hypothetical protein